MAGRVARSPSSALLPFFWEGSPTKDDRKKGTLILTSLLEDLAVIVFTFVLSSAGSAKS